MTFQRDPPRLRDLADQADDPLTIAIEEMAHEEPTSEQLGSVAARTRLALGLPPIVGSSSHLASSSGSGSVGASGAGGKGILGATPWLHQIAIPVVIGALGAVAMEFSRAPARVAEPLAPPVWIAPPSEHADRNDETSIAEVTPTASSLGPPEEIHVSESVPIAPIAAASRGKVARTDREPEQQPMAAPNPPESNATEISIVTSAHQAIAKNPLQALAFVHQHEIKFPVGALVQEREVIAIQALLQLARRSDAEARAARFRAQFPDSAHARRIDVLLLEDAKRH